MEIIEPNQEKINPQEITVSLRAANPSFLMYPTALFEVGSRFKWKARFLIGMGYLYALCFNGNTARTTSEELQKVLSTKSKSRIEELFEEVETLNRLAVVKAGGKHPDKFVRWVRGKRGRGGRTEVELVLPQDLSYIYPDNRFFPVPKITFLLPVSAQAKALYLLLHYLKDKETNRAVASTRSIARAISIDKASVGKLTEELASKGVLSVKTSRKGTEFFVRSPVYWPDETLFEIAQTYSLSHPFLKEWSITLPENPPRQPEKFPNRRTPSKNSPIDGHLNPQYTDTSPKNSPIDGHQKPAGESRPKAQEPPTTSNKKRITTSIYPTSNNKGGEEVENIRNCELCENLSKGEGEEVVLDRATEREKEEPRKTAESEKTYALPKTNAFQKKNNTGSSGELGRPNKSAQGVDAERLAKIKAFLKEVRSRVLEDARWYGVEPAKVDREFWKGLKEVYGEDWLTLALMYELLSIKSHPKYSRKVNSSPVGLLISFALKNSPASFRDFVSAYESVFGSFGELSEIEERRENLLFGLELERENNPEFGHLINLLKELSPYDRLFLYLEGAVKEKNGTFTLLFTSPEGIELFKRKLGERMDFFYPEWRALTVEKWEREGRA